MGYCLWDVGARKLICNHDVVVNEGNIHKKYIPTNLIHVMFQEDDVMVSNKPNPHNVGQR